jgi:hypothetical protein
VQLLMICTIGSSTTSGSVHDKSAKIDQDEYKRFGLNISSVGQLLP